MEGAERNEENVWGSVRGTIYYLLYSGGNERIPELASVACTESLRKNNLHKGAESLISARANRTPLGLTALKPP